MLAGGSFGKLDTAINTQQINPNRMIPAIRDGEFRTVGKPGDCALSYVIEYGADDTTVQLSLNQTRAVADQWMEWSASPKRLCPVIYLFFATVRTQSRRSRSRQDCCAARRSACCAYIILDGHLSKQSYVCGNDRFTMGDIPLGCVAYRYFNVDVDRPPLPHVSAWYQRLTERPAYRDHVMRHFGTNPDEWAGLEKDCASEGVI